MRREMSLMAPNGHGAMSDLSPLSGAKRKSDLGAVRSAFDPERTIARSGSEGSEQFASLLRLPLIPPQPRHARGCAQLPGFRLLCTRDFERPLETGFTFCQIPLWRHQGDFAGDAMDVGLVPLFLCRFDRRDCFANVAPGL